MKKIRIGHLTTSYHTAFILMGTRWIEQRIGVEPEWNLYGRSISIGQRAMLENFHPMGPIYSFG